MRTFTQENPGRSNFSWPRGPQRAWTALNVVRLEAGQIKLRFWKPQFYFNINLPANIKKHSFLLLICYWSENLFQCDWNVTSDTLCSQWPNRRLSSYPQYLECSLGPGSESLMGFPEHPLCVSGSFRGCGLNSQWQARSLNSQRLIRIHLWSN